MIKSFIEGFHCLIEVIPFILGGITAVVCIGIAVGFIVASIQTLLDKIFH